jgi:hypothetical protein
MRASGRVHRRENPANKPKSGPARAWIAPRRSPVRVRLAPLGESLQWRGFWRFAGGCESRPPRECWPGLWPDLRSSRRSPRGEKPHFKPLPPRMSGSGRGTKWNSSRSAWVRVPEWLDSRGGRFVPGQGHARKRVRRPTSRPAQQRGRRNVDACHQGASSTRHERRHTLQRFALSLTSPGRGGDDSGGRVVRAPLRVR